MGILRNMFSQKPNGTYTYQGQYEETMAPQENDPQRDIFDQDLGSDVFGRRPVVHVTTEINRDPNEDKTSKSNKVNDTEKSFSLFDRIKNAIKSMVKGGPKESSGPNIFDADQPDIFPRKNNNTPDETTQQSSRSNINHDTITSGDDSQSNQSNSGDNLGNPKNVATNDSINPQADLEKSTLPSLVVLKQEREKVDVSPSNSNPDTTDSAKNISENPTANTRDSNNENTAGDRVWQELVGRIGERRAKIDAAEQGGR
jgi:hypothetical protein